MKKLGDGSKVSEVVPNDDRLRCHSCKAVQDSNGYPGSPPAALWFPGSTVHEFTHSLVIMTRKFCCGAVSHTEPVASVSSYLRPVKESARLVCNLVNQYLLAGRPEPQWLTEAWAKWDERFTRPVHRSRKTG